VRSELVFSNSDTTILLSTYVLRRSLSDLQPKLLPFSMFPKAVSRTFHLEVERKFCGLAVTDLARHVGNPPFRTIQSQGQRVFNDTYFDRAGRLAAAGVWVRLRNGVWEAKVRKGGDFQNSRFEELSDPHKIGKQVQAITGQGCNEPESFGLDRIANMSTTRTTWLADERFTIVLDKMDFGHEVGEVELQSEVHLAYTGQALEDHKQRAMQQMDQEIVAFMQRYRWAFAAGVPIGKLTAYFKRKAVGEL
jgi:thiamine-triphosphatase